jgi:cysteine synthase A
VWSVERRRILRAYGADIVITPADHGMAGAVASAESIVARTERAFMPRQFENAANPDVHARITARERSSTPCRISLRSSRGSGRAAR